MSIARFAAGATLLAELEAHVPHAEARERIVRAAERLVQEAVDASAGAEEAAMTCSLAVACALGDDQAARHAFPTQPRPRPPRQRPKQPTRPWHRMRPRTRCSTTAWSCSSSTPGTLADGRNS